MATNNSALLLFFHACFSLAANEWFSLKKRNDG